MDTPTYKLQVKIRNEVCTHVPSPCSTGSRFPAREGSNIATCLVAPNHASPMGGLRCFHMSCGSEPRLSAKECSGAVMCLTALNGLWPTWIKKGLAALSTQLDSCVFKARSRVTKAPARRADMRRHYHLQDMWIGRYSAVPHDWPLRRSWQGIWPDRMVLCHWPCAA
jgi:hypothetical protein